MTGVEVLGGLGERFRDIANDGPLLLALPVAALAGLASFLSPCVLPLVPGYLSYMTGLSGADLEEGGEGDGTVRTRARSRVLVGSTLFVLGFSAVFVSTGALFGHFGNRLIAHQAGLNRVFGAVIVLFGLMFLGAFSRFAFFNRELRIHRLPVAGLAGAPLLGVVFGVGWTPCIGPTLGAVLTLAYQEGSAGRGAVLTFAYCLGLGLPFILAGLAFRRSMTLFAVVKRHYAVVTRVGGAMLVTVGLLLLTGWWGDFTAWLRTEWIGNFTPGV